MATSIRDLVYALESEAPYEAGTDRQSPDAAGALAELGRALRRLASAGLELDVRGRRDTITHDLAESCAQNAATLDLDRSGRLTGLAGSLADVVGVLSEQIGRDQRWVIAVEIASAARVLTTYAAEGDGRRTADLAWTHLTARALIVQALTGHALRAEPRGPRPRSAAPDAAPGRTGRPGGAGVDDGHLRSATSLGNDEQEQLVAGERSRRRPKHATAVRASALRHARVLENVARSAGSHGVLGTGLRSSPCAAVACAA